MRVYLGLVAFSLAGSLLSRLARVDPLPIAHPVSLLTLSFGCIAAFYAVVNRQGRGVLWGLVAVLAIGLLAELVGLRFGVPFGHYQYTNAWWPTVWIPSLGPFPLQLPFAWLLIVGCSYLFTTAHLDSGAVTAAALLATLVDQAMEPVMTGSLGYWRWTEKGPMAGGSPVINMAGWFFVSYLAALALKHSLSRALPSNRDPSLVLAGHLVLTLGIAGIAALPMQ